MDLSVVIPAFNESQKIGSDIKAAADFLDKNGLEGQIIIVDDGSSDGTSETAEKKCGSLPAKVNLKVIRNQRHRGKGYAIRTGIKETTTTDTDVTSNTSVTTTTEITVPTISPGFGIINIGLIVFCFIAYRLRRKTDTNND